MQTYHSHYRGSGAASATRERVDVPERIDPYATDTVVTAVSPKPPPRSGPRAGGSQTRTAPVLAPPELYADASPRSRGSADATPAGPAVPSRRVVVNDVARDMDRAQKGTYDRDASPPKRPLLVQVYNPAGPPESHATSSQRRARRQSTRSSPPSTDGPSGSGVSGTPLQRRDTVAEVPISSGSSNGGNGRRSAKESDDDSELSNRVLASTSRPRSQLYSVRDKRSESSKSKANAQGVRASTSSRNDGGGHDSLAESVAGSARGHQCQQPHHGNGSGGSDTPHPASPSPLLDLLSTVETKDVKEAKGPMAAAANATGGAQYVAQSAYTQRNPFRVQTFADFAAHPLLDPPEHFAKYPEVAGDGRMLGSTGDSSGGGGGAMLGEFLVNRLVDLTHPTSEQERVEMIDLLNSTLDTLQTGTWFYKWTRTNKVHRRFVWLNMQRGTLMWSASPKQGLVWNSELKISEVTSVKPDCIRDSTTGRSFYRMSIAAASRGVCLATEMPEKFDCWFKAIQQLTMPNLSSGVPGIWGRPTSVLSNGRRGAVGRWASRYSPLQAIADGTTGNLGGPDVRPGGRVSSSD